LDKNIIHFIIEWQGISTLSGIFAVENVGYPDILGPIYSRLSEYASLF